MMKQLSWGAHHLWDKLVKPGDTVVDATSFAFTPMILAHTIYLSNLVGAEGHVYAFDHRWDFVATVSRQGSLSSFIRSGGMPKMTFSHLPPTQMLEHGPTRARLVVFCLMPDGLYDASGNMQIMAFHEFARKRLAWQAPEPTIAAILAAMQLLQEGGVITILACKDMSGIVS
ncbi:hypothetical protein WJX73_004237 [Symbiochloris irregularis]|uniref:Uncharacterized protein n=1 Tax=Symbiochloris irregularis TaxID=706552 RepID=A0AAW1NU77_9CHLO